MLLRQNGGVASKSLSAERKGGAFPYIGRQGRKNGEVFIEYVAIEFWLLPFRIMLHRKFLFMFQREFGIEVEIEFQHVNDRLAEKAELATLCMRDYDLSHQIFGNPAFVCNAWNLKLGGRRRDMGIQSGC